MRPTLMLLLARRTSALLLLLAAGAHGSDSIESDHVPFTRCESLGYLPGKLPCGTCEVIKSVLVDQDHAALSIRQCFECCTASLDVNTPARFDHAVLHVHHATLGNYGGVKEFLEKQENGEGTQYGGAFEVVNKRA